MRIERATAQDLPAINDVVAAAASRWPLSQRNLRLTVPLLQYDPVDARHLTLLVSRRADEIVGFAAWDPEPLPGPRSLTGSLLHGLYVAPAHQRDGIGQRLQDRVFRDAARCGHGGVLVKAERFSRDYFEHCGYRRVTDRDTGAGAYPYIYWRELRS